MEGDASGQNMIPSDNTSSVVIAQPTAVIGIGTGSQQQQQEEVSCESDVVKILQQQNENQNNAILEDYYSGGGGGGKSSKSVIDLLREIDTRGQTQLGISPCEPTLAQRETKSSLLGDDFGEGIWCLG